MTRRKKKSVGSSHTKGPRDLRVHGKSGPVTTRKMTDEERRRS